MMQSPAVTTRLVLVLSCLIVITPRHAESGARISSLLMEQVGGQQQNEEAQQQVNEALVPWKDFEQAYTQLFATEGTPNSAGQTRDFIQFTLQQIPSYTRNTGLSKHDIDVRKGTSKLVGLMNQIPEIGSGKKECSLQDLSMRIVFETIFAQNVHISTFLKYYNNLYYHFCINNIDREIIKKTAANGLQLPAKFDEMKKFQSQAANDLPNSPQAAQIARGLSLYLRANRHNVERAGEKPAEHIKRLNKLVNDEIVNEFKCKELDLFDGLLPKYKLVASFKTELSDDSRKWVDIIDLCDKITPLTRQLVLVDMYEIEAARLSTIIFMPASSPDFQHHNPELVEEDLKLIIDVLSAKKRLYREDHRNSISKLEEVKFTLGNTNEFCTLINVRKLQQLMVEYNGFPNISNYLLHKAKNVSNKCRDKVHAEILANSKKLDEQDTKKLTNLRLRITDATDVQFRKRLHHYIPVQSFVEGTMGFLLSNEYQKEDGFELIAKYLAPKTEEESETMREGAYMLLGDLCDDVENNFAVVYELFTEFDKLSEDTNDFDEQDRDWMANVKICSMIKFGNV